MARRPYESLRYPDFRRLWTAQLVSVTGSQMQTAALNWHVYLLTRSPLALGFVGLTRVLPIVALSLAGGVVADRRDRRAVMFAAQSVMLLVSAGLAVLTWTRHERLWVLYALNALQAGATAFDNPARHALVPRLVPIDDLPGALAMNLAMFEAALIAGPALAGSIIAAMAKGTAPVVAGVAPHDAIALSGIYAVNAISFVAVLFVLVRLRTSGAVEPTESTQSHPVDALKEGLRFVFTTPLMVWTMGIDFLATFFAGSLSLLPVFADQVLHVGARGYGWLAAAPAAGALLASLYTSLHPLPVRQGRLLLWCIAVYGVATVVYGLSRNLTLTLVALAVTGAADLVSTVIRQTLRQLLTPDALRGRMTSVNMIFFMGGPQLGEMEAGLVASLFASAALGVTVSVVSGGLATLGIAVAAGLRGPIRAYAVGREPAHI